MFEIKNLAHQHPTVNMLEENIKPPLWLQEMTQAGGNYSSLCDFSSSSLLLPASFRIRSIQSRRPITCIHESTVLVKGGTSIGLPGVASFILRGHAFDSICLRLLCKQRNKKNKTNGALTQPPPHPRKCLQGRTPL